MHRRTGLAVQAVLIRVHRPQPLRRAQPLHLVLPSPDAVLSCELVGEDAIPELAGGRRMLWSQRQTVGTVTVLKSAATWDA